jgi:large subunit ribosomal protein L6
MLSTSRGAALRAISSSPSISIPAFLVPAFQSSARAFSATTSTQSQIGRAPLSIPPEVNFSVTYPTAPKNARPSPEQLRPTVKVEGPLGTLSMTIPTFVNIEHDTVAKKAFVTVEDREVRKQREMWGMI